MITETRYRALLHGETTAPVKNQKTKTAPQLIEKPVYLLVTKDTPISATNAANARDIYDSVRQRGVDLCYYETLPRGYSDSTPLAKAEVYARIETYLHALTTNAKVILGPLQIIEDKTPAEKRR